MLKSYKELTVWQKSINLVEEIYLLTNKFPKEEVYGLSIQMRRAAISIPSNIAEGQRRKDLPEFLQFLRIADASSAELETQIIISKKLYLNLEYSRSENLLDEIQKMLSAMIRKLGDKLKTKNSKLKTNGAAALLTVLMVGGIIVEIAIAFILITYFLSQSGFGAKMSAEALDAAQAGIQDGIMKVVRDKNINYTTSGSPYPVAVANRSAQIKICKDTKTVVTACDTATNMSGKHEITSLGMAFTKRRELRAILNVNSATGEVKVESIQEIAL